MSDEVKLHKNEALKAGSHQLRGTIARELATGQPHGHKPFGDESEQLIKFHGSYQQDNRDLRHEKNPDGTPKGKEYMFMVRTRIPGGKVTAKQFLAELDLCERFGNGTLRVTTLQGFHLHGGMRANHKAQIQPYNDIKLTPLAACGEVERNVMCCQAPHNNNSVRREMQAMADRVAEHLKPRTIVYYELWLTDEAGEKTD